MGIFDRIDIEELKKHPDFEGMNDEEVKEAFLNKLSGHIIVAYEIGSARILAFADALKDLANIDLEADDSGTGILDGESINSKLNNSMYNVIVNFLEERGTSESEFMEDIGTRLTGKDTLYEVLHPEDDKDDMSFLILIALKDLYEFDVNKIIEASVEGIE